MAQTVTVTGVDEHVAGGQSIYTIVTDPATSSDSSYNGLDSSDVSVTNELDDVASINVSPTSGLVTTQSGGTASFSVALATIPSGPVSIAVASSNTAEGTVSPATLVFDSTDWNDSQTVTITGADGAPGGSDVDYLINLGPASSADPNYSGLVPSVVSVTNVHTGMPQLTISGTSVLEGDSGMTNDVFTVTLSNSSGQTVSVDFATADGSGAAKAVAGQDYVATTGTLTFDPGVTSLTFSVPVLGDTTPEPDETFLVTLANPVNATIATAQATGTIVNNDAQLMVTNVTKLEGNSGTTEFDFDVQFVDPFASALPVSVHVSTASGTAQSDSDFQSVDQIVTFNPGDIGPIKVPVQVIGDTTPEPNETFFVTLSNPVNATIAAGQGIGDILNDDTEPAVDLSISATNVQFSPANPAPDKRRRSRPPSRTRAHWVLRACRSSSPISATPSVWSRFPSWIRVHPRLSPSRTPFPIPVIILSMSQSIPVI